MYLRWAKSIPPNMKAGTIMGRYLNTLLNVLTTFVQMTEKEKQHLSNKLLLYTNYAFTHQPSDWPWKDRLIPYAVCVCICDIHQQKQQWHVFLCMLW